MRSVTSSRPELAVYFLRHPNFPAGGDLAMFAFERLALAMYTDRSPGDCRVDWLDAIERIAMLHTFENGTNPKR